METKSKMNPWIKPWSFTQCSFSMLNSECSPKAAKGNLHSAKIPAVPNV